MKVDVYWNLHKKVWSVRHKGLVLKHSSSVYISDAKFVVQPAGNAKVRKTRRKTVHAFVRGELKEKIPIANKKRVQYNPYKYKSFVEFDSKIPIYKSQSVFLSEDGKCFIDIGSQDENFVSCEGKKERAV